MSFLGCLILYSKYSQNWHYTPQHAVFVSTSRVARCFLLRGTSAQEAWALPGIFLGLAGGLPPPSPTRVSSCHPDLAQESWCEKQPLACGQPTCEPSPSLPHSPAPGIFLLSLFRTLSHLVGDKPQNSLQPHLGV